MSTPPQPAAAASKRANAAGLTLFTPSTPLAAPTLRSPTSPTGASGSFGFSTASLSGQHARRKEPYEEAGPDLTLPPLALMPSTRFPGGTLGKQSAKSMQSMPTTPVSESPSADGESHDQLGALIQELEKQLDIELKIKSGAEQLYRHYTLRKRQDKKSTAETLDTLSRTTTRIEKLRKEILKLRSHAESLGIDVSKKPHHVRAASSPNMENDESDSEEAAMPLYFGAVQSRIHRIKEKIEVESSIKAGIEKMAKATGGISAGGDKFQPSQAVNEIFKSLSSSTARLALLNIALIKYQNMLIGENVHEATQLQLTPYSFVAYIPPVADHSLLPGLQKSSSKRLSFFQSSTLFPGRSHETPIAVTPTNLGPNSNISGPSNSSSTSTLVSSGSGPLTASPSSTLKKDTKIYLSGRLTVKVMEAVNLFKPSLKPEDVYVTIKIDGTMRDKTRPKSRSSLPEWNETFVLKLDKAVEIEFEIFEGQTLRGLAFFRLNECQQEWSLTDGVVFAYFYVEPYGQLRLQLQFVKDVVPTRRLSQKVRRGAIVRKKGTADIGLSLSFGNNFASSLFPSRKSTSTKAPEKMTTRGAVAAFFTGNSGARDAVVTELVLEDTKDQSPPMKTKLPASDVTPDMKKLVAARLQVPAFDAEEEHNVQHPAALLENYHMIKTLGRGNFGKVMLVEDKQTGKLHALKILKKQNIIANDEMSSVKTERLIFQIANKDQHPFLVNLHACFQSPTRLFFIMDYIAGGDLMLHIQRSPFTVERAVFYGAEVLLALEFLHKNKVIYRDLKLDNILLGLDGHIRIADYGLCKALSHADELTNTFCGTPEFMAPEILLEQDYGRGADWWAFGVLLYEMLLSESPFDGEGEEEIFHSVLHSEVSYPKGLPAVAESLLKKLLVRDPQQRLGSSHRDAEDIKRHQFFRGMDWDRLLRREIQPPVRPFLTSERDTTNFDASFTSEPAILTPMESTLSKFEQAEFDNFTYTAPWLANVEPPVRTSQDLPSRMRDSTITLCFDRSGADSEGFSPSVLDDDDSGGEDLEVEPDDAFEI